MPLEIRQALEGLKDRLIELNEDECQALALSLLERGADQNSIKESFLPALLEIGQLYQSGRYFASSLIMAGRIVRKILKILYDRPLADLFPGRLLMGALAQRSPTCPLQPVVGLLLASVGFEVWDLGQDTSMETFLAEARLFKPNVIGLYLGATPGDGQIRLLIKAVKDQWPQNQIPFFFLAGSQAHEPLRKKTGADYAMGSVAAAMSMYHRLIMSYPNHAWPLKP
jgi:methanogenic corrinoid protein MtbC1